MSKLLPHSDCIAEDCPCPYAHRVRFWCAKCGHYQDDFSDEVDLELED